ncbi:hypothetical protein ACS77_13165 [Pseudomonas syringae]|uniref:Uncharacterized protein n=1 Tax=Pseudomonas syringae TaxID=317 RepID=A0A0L1MFR7_PSESX|nr:hypothetical protein ACS77_13165 [Pseudomonas syringae]
MACGNTVADKTQDALAGIFVNFPWGIRMQGGGTNTEQYADAESFRGAIDAVSSASPFGSFTFGGQS